MKKILFSLLIIILSSSCTVFTKIGGTNKSIDQVNRRMERRIENGHKRSERFYNRHDRPIKMKDISNPK